MLTSNWIKWSVDILMLNEVSVFQSLSRLFVTDWWWLQHNGLRSKSIIQCLISFPLTARPLVLRKIQAPNGSSLLATETRATSGTSAHLLMQLHNVTSRSLQNFTKLQRISQVCHSPFFAGWIAFVYIFFLQKVNCILDTVVCMCFCWDVGVCVYHTGEAVVMT